jgi:hypothetical protein
MRRVFTIVFTIGMLLAGESAALADATANAHNCGGAFSSSVTPAFVAGGDFGQAVAGSAQAGTRDDAIQVLVDALANCGSTP